MLKLVGRFFYNMSIPYSKPPKRPKELVALLQERGLKIDGFPKAENYITNIGYFRLSAYFYPLLQIPKSDHIYKPESSFTQVLNLYRFDRKLRLLIFNEIEKIEVAIRSIMVNIASLHFNDAFWITNQSNFHNLTFFKSSLEDIDNELSKSKEDFILHFKNTYSDVYPPSWALAEILPLGNICRIYRNIKDQNLKKQISQKFGLQPPVFDSWIMTIAGLRNICCHHGRLWNRLLILQPVLPVIIRYPWLRSQNSADKQKVYFRMCIIKYLLYSVSPNNTFKEKLKDLLEKYPMIDIKAMGFTLDWEKEPIWIGDKQL